jgi:hypothetical protein
MCRRNHGGTYGGAVASLTLVSSGLAIVIFLFNFINIIGNFITDEVACMRGRREGSGLSLGSLAAGRQTSLL